MFIKKVEIKNIWRQDFIWTLNEDVDVLVGENGSGKSTILSIVKEAISPIDDIELNYRVFDPIDEVIIELTDNIVIRANSEERKISGNIDNSLQSLNLCYINTFDVIEKSVNPNLTLLDFEIEKLKHEFIKYQRDLSNQVEEAFKNNDSSTKKAQLDKIQSLYDTKNLFIAKINSLFAHTEKTFDEKNFCFKKNNIENPIEIKKLSSGEKQILIILLTTLLQDNRKTILLLDEPEISLHVDWQRELINHIRALNPNCQIIMSTHSPSVYYKGWTDKAYRISELFSPTDFSNQSVIISETYNQNDPVENIKSEFYKLTGNKATTKLYLINRLINNINSLTKAQCYEILNFLKHENIFPDVITFTTLISKLNNYSDAKEIFDLIETEIYSTLYKVRPNEITLNTLLKKIDSVERGIKLIREIGEKEKLQLRPDIISFSTILGKAKNNEEIRLIEETRKYFGIKHNEIYLNKLSFKR